MISSAFWRDRPVFIAGHTGFRGAWLSIALERLAARATGYGLNPEAGSVYDLADAGAGLCDVRGDVNDSALLDGALRAADPEIAFHFTPVALRRALAEAAAGAPALQASIVAAPDRRRRARREARQPRTQGRTYWVYCAATTCAAATSAPETTQGSMHVLDEIYAFLLLAEIACEGADSIARDWAFAEPADAAAIGWSPLLDAAEAARWSAEWNAAVARGADMAAFTRAQVDAYLGQRVRFVSPFTRAAAALDRSAA
ncbi:MAG: hypothetical protein KGM42_12590 [Hyphomicrobiales bacterium]|nr:hypothetical protein [Hyphomicrobiales bacterium]